MTKNSIETQGGTRRITVYRNEVSISFTDKEVDYGSKKRESFKKRYQIINEISIGEHNVAQCIEHGEITVFSITMCQMICRAPQAAAVEYFVVGGELFVKITDGIQQFIYDEIGNLIQTSDSDDLSVIFSGCGVVLQKTSKEDGKTKLYNFEGYPVK